MGNLVAWSKFGVLHISNVYILVHRMQFIQCVCMCFIINAKRHMRACVCLFVYFFVSLLVAYMRS